METSLAATKGQKVVTDSLIVAEKLSKQHKDVLKKMKMSSRMMKEVGSILCRPHTLIRRKKPKKYIMDRRSFPILRVSFTGKKALKWIYGKTPNFPRNSVIIYSTE